MCSSPNACLRALPRRAALLRRLQDVLRDLQDFFSGTYSHRGKAARHLELLEKSRELQAKVLESGAHRIASRLSSRTCVQTPTRDLGPLSKMTRRRDRKAEAQAYCATADFFRQRSERRTTETRSRPMATKCPHWTDPHQPPPQPPSIDPLNKFKLPMV